MEDFSNKILEKLKEKDYIKRFISLSFALFLTAINYNLFILPSKIVTGGTSGIATICKNLFNMDPSLVVFLLSFLVVILSLIFLNDEDTVAAGFITIVYPLFIKATEGFGGIFLIDFDSKLLIAIFAGLIGGLTNGMIYKTDLNTGGFGVLSKIIGQKNSTPVSKVNFIINILIVILGGFIFGFSMILYACIYLYINKVVSERILLGSSKNKMFYIISDKYDKIASYIMDELNHDVTLFDVKGKFSFKKKKNIMTIIPTYQYFLVKERIKEIDNKAFVSINDSYEVIGQDRKINSVNNKKYHWFSRIFSKKMV